MRTILCNCGSDQVNYVGIDDVEGNTVIELFKCQECGSYIEISTIVADDDDDEYDTWDSRRDSLLPQP